ncbi:CinA family protein [Bartonella sp. DGB1]|uniref:CinA family protein n=1 Tax=Bartonella sp. DGB1 TaxID=3239807 RepID=UPI0035253FC5
MIQNSIINKQIKYLVELCLKYNIKITTAESCTGGLLAAYLTNISGVSKIFDQGYITYSNDAKINLLDVKSEILQKYGAVAEQTATAMAEGALKKANATLAFAITGIAGPTGGTDEKPVGLIYIAIAVKSYKTKVKKLLLGNKTRDTLREMAIEHILALAIEEIEHNLI